MSLDFYLEYEIDDNYITVFDNNITHNLNEMANKAGIYFALWRPKEKGYEKASDIIEILEKGLSDLVAIPSYFKKFDAENGWGTYEHFVPFVRECLEACKKYPNAKIRASI
jgi:hypothetical protein